MVNQTILNVTVAAVGLFFFTQWLVLIVDLATRP